MSITETELVYFLHLHDGNLTIKYLSIVDVKTANSLGLKAAVDQAFKRKRNFFAIRQVSGAKC